MYARLSYGFVDLRDCFKLLYLKFGNIIFCDPPHLKIRVCVPVSISKPFQCFFPSVGCQIQKVLVLTVIISWK